MSLERIRAAAEGAALTIFSAGTGDVIGAGLIAAGVGHFAATYNEFKQTGDWGAASKNSGVFFNISFKTDFGYGDSKDKQNGIVQNEPIVTINSDTNRGGKDKESSSFGTGTCPNCLDPSTIGHNLVGSYPGGNNPKSYNGEYNYSYVPQSIAEYPAIGHDRRYDNIHTTGFVGLLTDSKAIGADWKFVKEELSIALDPVAMFGTKERLKAGGLGIGLGFIASFKTVLTLAQPDGYMRIKMWYIVSNSGVNNVPAIHKH